MAAIQLKKPKIIIQRYHGFMRIISANLACILLCFNRNCFCLCHGRYLYFAKKHQQPDQPDRLYRCAGGGHDPGDHHPAYRSSVGFLAGFLGRWRHRHGILASPRYIVIPLILGFGVLAGLLTGFLSADENPSLRGHTGWMARLQGALQLDCKNRHDHYSQ